MIECHHVRTYAREARAPMCRFEAHDAAKRSRIAYRPASIRTERKGAESCGDARCRPTARSSGYAIYIPWIVRRAEMRVDGRGCCCKLVREALAQQNCAGVAEAHDAIGVSSGNVIAKKAGTVRRANVRRLDDVFGAIGYPVQGAAHTAPDEVRLRRFGFLPCLLCGYGQISTKRRVQR